MANGCTSFRCTDAEAPTIEALIEALDPECYEARPLMEFEAG